MPPFYSTDPYQMQYDIVNEEPVTLGMSGEVLHLVKGLLEKNPEKRLGAKYGIQEIKDHQFFREINWKDIENKKYKYEKMAFLKIEYVNTNFEKAEQISVSDDDLSEE